METQARELMERQSERTGDFPQVQQRLRQHLQETEQQLRRIEDCLRQCGESESTFKDTALSAMANLTAMAHAMAGDEILRTRLPTTRSNTTRSPRISRCSPVQARRDRPFRAAHNSRREEEQMASWIDSHFEDVTLQYLAKEERAAA
jgi:hypothetical protein